MYEIGPIFWYRLLFMAELLAAETLLVYRFKLRALFFLRLLGATAACFGFAFAMPIVSEGVGWSSTMYILLFGFTVLAIWFCFKEQLITIIFYAVAAYTIQHIAHELFSLSALAMNFNAGGSGSGSAISSFWIYSNSSTTVNANPFTIITYFFVYGVTYFTGYYLIKRRVKEKYEFGGTNIKMFLLAVLILFFDIVVSAFITDYSASEYSMVYLILINAFNVACCIFALIFQFFVDKQAKLVSELRFIERMWNEKRNQYDITKENIELINQKCHDLKHQIRKIGKNAIDPQIVSEIENVVSIYDSPILTGNEALDIIITEKSLVCNKNGIKLSCVIDGKAIGFIGPADTYALFGNILDNAIEAVIPLDNGEKTVSLSVKKKNKFVIVNTHNKCRKVPEFDGGLPRTTKSNRNIHGFGMKSVKLICTKYGGELSVTCKGDMFNLNMLFPICSGAEESREGV